LLQTLFSCLPTLLSIPLVSFLQYITLCLVTPSISRLILPQRRHRRRNCRHYYLRVRRRRYGTSCPQRERPSGTLLSYDDYIQEHFMDPNCRPFLARVTPPFLSLPSSLVHTFLDSFDHLEHYKQLLSIVSEGNLPSPVLPSVLYHKAIRAAANLSGSQPTIPSNVQVYTCKREEELPIVIDTGASFSVTPTISDFCGPIKPADLLSLKGLKDSVTVCGMGPVKWEI
jgi:hypothetical protein